MVDKLKDDLIRKLKEGKKRIKDSKKEGRKK